MTIAAHIIDEETYTMLQDIMEDEFAELVDVFRKDVLSALDALQQCLAQADAEEVGCICHKLKSSSMLIGAFGMAEFARLLGEYKDDHDLARANRHFQQLVTEYTYVATWLDARQPLPA